MIDDDRLFIDLFEGNDEAYGSNEGGCVRFAPPWQDHLMGQTPMGVYPLIHDRVKWGCVDLDVKSEKKPSGDYASEKDAHTAARNLYLVLEALGITAWIERTRSAGRHVWVFADEWVLAACMRRALLVACGLAEVSVREVNPKQETGFGNYVRLPYPGVAINEDAGTQVMIDPGDQMPITYEGFVSVASQERTSKATLEGVAQHYVAPPQAAETPAIVTPYEGDLKALARQLGGRGYTVFMHGPTTGDRSAALQYIAHYAFEGDLTYDQAFTLVEDLDQRLGKYVGRHDRDRRLHEIIRRAYGR